MEQLGRYPLSVILSYLSETEGTSLLLCRKVWSKHLLPVFELPPSQHPENNGGQTILLLSCESLTTIASISTLSNSKQQPNQTRIRRHRFMEYPVPDASTRLDRLNTRKWRQKCQRIQKQRQIETHPQFGESNSLFMDIAKTFNLSTQQYAMMEWKQRVHVLDSPQKRGVAVPSGLGQHEPRLLQFWSKSIERDLLSGNNSESCRSHQLFLPGTTVLASYPRSGNTLVRSLLEDITGFVTSSDTRPDRPLSIALSDQYGLVGEGRIAGPICKTHWPERMGCTPFVAARVILLVRNPWDAIDSYWHLNLTNTHTKKVIPQVYQDHWKFFHQLVRNELSVWLEFLDFYWKQKSVPVLLVRFEDLIQNPSREVQRMLQFCTRFDWWQPQLEAVLGNHSSPLSSSSSSCLKISGKHGYQSTSSESMSTSFGGSLRRRSVFDNQLLEELHNLMDILDGNGWLEKLGYHVIRQNFPKNANPLLPELPSHPKSVSEGTNDVCSSLYINQPLSKELRPRDSPFGRNMRQWRREHTNDDTEPFPTVSNFQN